MPFCARCLTELTWEWFRRMRTGKRARRCRLCEAKIRLQAVQAEFDALARRREREEGEARSRRGRAQAAAAAASSAFSDWDRRTRIAAGDRPDAEE